MASVGRFVTLVLTLVLIVSACGGDEASTTSTSVDAATVTTTATSAPATTMASTTTVTADTAPETAAPTTVATATTVAALEAIEITSFDYEYRGVPAIVEAGSPLELINGSSEEYHTMFVIRLDSTDERTLADFAMLDIVDFIDAEGTARFGTTQAIIGAEYGEDAVVYGGSNRPVEPGRYLILCFTGVGTDPAEAAAQMSIGRPTAADLEDEVPHYRAGEIAEFVITG